MSPQPLTGFEQKIVVGLAEVKVSNDPHVTLSAYALGSCLGVAIYDPVARTGGLLHAMLPDSSVDPARAISHPGMFVDTGVAALFRAAYALGADKHRVIISTAGGAQILDTSGCFEVGRQNGEALTRLLRQHVLTLHAGQTGGLVNRTMYLNMATGEVRIKISGQGAEEILCKNSTIT